MSDIEIKCKNCSREFSLMFADFNLSLRCPNCNKFGLVSAFSTNFISQPSWKTGYEMNLDTFEDLLKHGGKYALKNFFKKHLDLSFIRRASGSVSFKDRSNYTVSLSEVYEIIQQNWLLQRWIYNLEFATSH